MTDPIKSGFTSIVSKSKLSPQESLLRIKKGKKELLIGIPKESLKGENRIALTPEAVSVLTLNGHQIIVESGAGKAANFSDNSYSEAGAQIDYSNDKVYHSDIVLKVRFPNLEEISKLKVGNAVISTIHAGNDIKESLREINKKKIIAIGYEYIEDKVGGLPIVRAMSEVAGSVIIPIAAEYLSNTQNGQGVILGGITGVPRTNVTILGAGTVAEFTARAAIGLGADVKIFDNHIYKLRRLKQILPNQVYTSTIEQTTLKETLKSCDVLIGALRSEKGQNRHIVSEETVASMKDGAVIIDVSIDEGGCIETSVATSLHSPVFTKHGVIHYCVPNIASKVAGTASKALSNIFSLILMQIADSGGLDDMIFQNKWFMKGVYAYKGSLTNYYLSKRFDLPFKDLNLLIAARY